MSNIIGQNLPKRGYKKEITEEENMDSNQKSKVVAKQEMPPPTIIPEQGCPKIEVIGIKKEPEDKARNSTFIIKWPGLPKIDLNKIDETRTEEKDRACQVEPFTTIKMPNEMLEDPNDYSLVYEDGLLSIESMQTAVADTQLSKIIYTSPNRNRKRYRIITKPKKMEPASNETIIIERPRLPNEAIIKDIMTNDGSSTADKAILKKNIPLKFEMVRTKTHKFKEGEEKHNLQVEANPKVAKQEKSGASKQKTSATSSFVEAANKLNFNHGSASAELNKYLNTAKMSKKAAYKASQEEFREREKQRKDNVAYVLLKKAVDALEGKETLKQANIEQKKQKYDEKELKTKEQGALKQSKQQKVLKMQEQKEEQSEKLQKTKEEVEEKRIHIQQKRQEIFDKEKHKPNYLPKKMPLLPTFDCYHLNEEDAPETGMVKPDWLTCNKMHERLGITRFVKSSYVNTLFCLKPHTPNLQKKFVNIDPKKLMRKCSAVWKHQPRFTCLKFMKLTSLVRYKI